MSDAVGGPPPARRRPSLRVLLAAGVLVALLLAGVVSHFASSKPDGLQKVAGDTGFSSSQRRHASDGSPLAGYSAKGVHDRRLSRGLAGVAGVTVTLALGGGLFLVLGRGRRRDDSPGGSAATADARG